MWRVEAEPANTQSEPTRRLSRAIMSRRARGSIGTLARR